MTFPFVYGVANLKPLSTSLQLISLGSTLETFYAKKSHLLLTQPLTKFNELPDLVRQQGVVPDEADRDAGHRRNETSGREQQSTLRSKRST